MIIRVIICLAVVLLAACSAEPMPKQKVTPPAADVANNSDQAVKTERKSIEEAADAAAKLIESEAQAEIESMRDNSSE
jgi:PBP1b-binding outer membrane lipoprotein LpoB